MNNKMPRSTNHKAGLVAAFILFILFGSNVHANQNEDCFELIDVLNSTTDFLKSDFVQPCSNEAWLQLSLIAPEVYGPPDPRTIPDGVKSPSYYMMSRQSIYLMQEYNDVQEAIDFFVSSILWLSAQEQDSSNEFRQVVWIAYLAKITGTLDRFREPFQADIDNLLGRQGVRSTELFVKCLVVNDIPSASIETIMKTIQFKECIDGR